jgi:hypothetical protein
MNKYKYSLTLMQHCINAKSDTIQSSYAMTRLLQYMMDNFTDPRTYQDPRNQYTTQDNGKYTGSVELINATREIILSGSTRNIRPEHYTHKPWTQQQWLELLNQIPPAFKEPVFIIAIFKYLLAIEKVPVQVDLMNHNGTFTEFHNRYGALVLLSA